MSAELIDWIRSTLELGQRYGIIAPGAIEPHVDHARGYVNTWESHAVTGCVGPPSRVVDLGSGAGLPALVLAGVWTEATFTLTETREKRSEFLRRAIGRLDIEDRVEVWHGDVQDMPAPGPLADLVTARAFGRPALVAECGQRLLAPGGRIIVSEPGSGSLPDRWPSAFLSARGLTPYEVETHHGTFALLAYEPEDEAQLPSRSRRSMERSPWY